MSPNEIDINASIATLDDATAVRILTAVCAPMLRRAEGEPPVPPEAAEALGAAWGVTRTGAAASTGEIARHALMLLDQVPEISGPIEAMVRNPGPQRFALEPVSGTLLITFALFALQSHMEFSRDKEGKWEFKFKKTPTKDGMLTPLIKKLVTLISGGPPQTH